MLVQSQQPTVANFVQKSFQIISNQQNNHIIQWLSSGRQFIIKDTDLFENIILPHYFRHRNINSFIRQLNMYGFHKSRKQPTKNIFSHPNFTKGKPENLINVKRKLKQDKQNQQNLLIDHVNSTGNITNAPNINKKIKIDHPIKQSNPNNNIINNNRSNINSTSNIIFSRQTLKSRNHFESYNQHHHNHILQRKQKQLQKTAIKPTQQLTSFCSIGHLQQVYPRASNSDLPFIRSLFQKSQIMQLNPQIYGMKYQNITSLNHIDQIQFELQNDIKQDNEIQKQRKKLNNRMLGYNILQTINFMNEMEMDM